MFDLHWSIGPHPQDRRQALHQRTLAHRMYEPAAENSRKAACTGKTKVKKSAHEDATISVRLGEQVWFCCKIVLSRRRAA